jgi:hypothetical protein
LILKSSIVITAASLAAVTVAFLTVFSQKRAISQRISHERTGPSSVTSPHSSFETTKDPEATI